jgi:hypothetical protein
MKIFGLLLSLFFLSSFNVYSQTTLVAGDIAIVGLNCDDPDDFAFVLLTDISTNTVINFTDNGWLASGGFRTGEGVLTFTAPSNLTAGLVVIYSANTSNFTNSGSFLLSTSGDQIIAFQGNLASPTIIYALNNDGAGVWQIDATNSNTSALPTGLTNGVSAVAINEIDNAYYSGGVNADLTALRLAIGNNDNWTSDDTNPFNLGTLIPNPLPVELTSFSATTIGSTVKLSWKTETEVSNYGFEVERYALSAERQAWEKIGFVNGNGNSNSPKSYTYEDKDVTAGKYSYRLKQIDNDGQFEYSKTIEVDLGVPKKFELSQNYPNPFNPTTTIKFNLPEAGNVKLTLFNILGQEIKTLVNEFKESGVHTINFDASELNSGMYIYKIEAGNFVQTRKMTLVK